MYAVYILYSPKLDRYYIGSTGDLEDRIARHNGSRSTATKGGVPWTIAYCEEFETKSQAYRRELQIKSWKSRAAIERLMGNV